MVNRKRIIKNMMSILDIKSMEDIVSVTEEMSHYVELALKEAEKESQKESENATAEIEEVVENKPVNFIRKPAKKSRNG